VRPTLTISGPPRKVKRCDFCSRRDVQAERQDQTTATDYEDRRILLGKCRIFVAGDAPTASAMTTNVSNDNIKMTFW
jgi:hypothetical protein